MSSQFTEKLKWKQFPMEGVEIWRNPKNGFVVFQLHYTANELKRNDQWKGQARAGLSSAKWNQEYEINWDAFRGKPVYHDFNERIHGSQGTLLPERGLPLLRGWDFGLTPACIVSQLQGRQLVVLKEFIGNNMGIKRFAGDVVVPGCKLLFPDWQDQKRDYYDFIDPAGLARAQTDETTCAQHMFAAGIKNIHPGPITWNDRIEGVEQFLLRFYKRGNEVVPGLQVSLAGCPTLVRGFKGGYQYPEKSIEIEPEIVKALKNSYSHPHDAFQMICGSISTLLKHRTNSGSIPIPGFNNRR